MGTLWALWPYFLHSSLVCYIQLLTDLFCPLKKAVIIFLTSCMNEGDFTLISGECISCISVLPKTHAPQPATVHPLAPLILSSDTRPLICTSVRDRADIQSQRESQITHYRTGRRLCVSVYWGDYVQTPSHSSHVTHEDTLSPNSTQVKASCTHGSALWHKAEQFVCKCNQQWMIL